MQDSNETLEQISAVNKLTGLSPFVLEKDIYLTQVISTVSDIAHDHYDLVFQGGTSLSKAHRIIERMSEDCDFRMRFKSSEKNVSREFKRKALRKFRHELVGALRRTGFGIDDSEVRVRNEGQFMAFRVNYPSIYPATDGIKPFLALEFFLAEVKVEPENKSVTTLIQQILGSKVKHIEFPVNTVAIIETAAEKWVGLTRRVATCAHRKHYRDASLVRHLYDLYKINEHGYFTDEFQSLISRIVHDDRRQYKNHNDAYYCNPAHEIKRAVDELHRSEEWRNHWERFVDVMVFAREKPTYDAVLGNLQSMTGAALPELQDIVSSTA